MLNKSKRIPSITNFLNNSNFRTKITIYMSTKTAGTDYDTYEQNYTYTNLNPITINGYVTEISPEALIWKQYGLQNLGAMEILCESKYKNLFLNCNKLTIEGDNYTVMKDGTGTKTLIMNRPKKLIKVMVTRND